MIYESYEKCEFLKAFCKTICFQDLQEVRGDLVGRVRGRAGEDQPNRKFGPEAFRILWRPK